LPILGGGIWPVQWVDAGAKDLRYDAKVDYLLMAVETFARDQDSVAAQTRWKELIPDNAKQAVKDEAMKAVEQLRTDPNYGKYSQDLTAFGAAVGVPILPGAIVPTPEAKVEPTQPAKVEKTKAEAKPTDTLEAGQPTATVAPLDLLATASAAQTQQSPTGGTKSTSLLVPVLAVLCISTLIVGGVLVYYVFLRKKPGRLAPRPATATEGGATAVEGDTSQNRRRASRGWEWLNCSIHDHL